MRPIPNIQIDYKSYSGFIDGSFELLSMPEFCEVLGLIFPLQKEPEAIADYFRLLRQRVLIKRRERTQQSVARNRFVSRRWILWNHGVTQIRRIFQIALIPSLLGSPLLSFLYNLKPLCGWHRGLLALLLFALYPYFYFSLLIKLCQPETNRTSSLSKFAVLTIITRNGSLDKPSNRRGN